MNLHVPQSIEAEVEIMVNSRCALHIVSPQSNGPVNGIVQDGLDGSFTLTMTWEDGSCTMVPRDEVYMIYKNAKIPENRVKDLIFRAKNFYPKYIVKSKESPNSLDFAQEIPGMLFVSIVFPQNLCYTRRTEVHPDPNRAEVKIEDGILQESSGPLCKKTIGSAGGSIVHMLWLRAPEFALKFLSELQQVTDRWLPTHGFSMGIADCFASSSEAVAKTLIETRSKVAAILKSAETPEQAEIEINTVLNSAMAVGPSLAKGSMAKGWRNALNIMRNSGAKGSVINLAQIVAFVGQQNIKGQRMPMSLSHGTRCLPSFLPGDNSPDARGFIEDNYISGLTPQAAFFHAAAGRDGIISTSLKSVTGETPIVIIDQFGESKHVLIGDWIDGLLNEHNENVKHYTEREMELLNVENYSMYIPTTDEFGNVTWGAIKNVTRHDPGQKLFRIQTLGGRNVTVTESKALLVWDKNTRSFIRKDTPLVNVGDFVPTAAELPDPIIETDHKYLQFDLTTQFLDVGAYLPKTENIYGTDFNDVKKMVESVLKNKKKMPPGWWDEHNGQEFTLPYKKIQLFRRVLVRSDIEGISDGCVYPFAAKRGANIPTRLELNRENGTFFGLFLAEGNADIPSGYVAITNSDPTIREFIKQWFDNHNIKWNETSKINQIGGLSEGVRGFSKPLGQILTKLVGHGARNKFVPDVAFTAPKEFVIGLLDGYFSGDGTISDNSIVVTSASERLITGINMLLSRLGIFGKISIYIMKGNNIGTTNIAHTHSLSIRGQWAKIFAKTVKLISVCKAEKLNNFNPSNEHRNFTSQNNIVLDQIVSIEEITIDVYHREYPQYNAKVYDLTVPSTLNFGLANGLHVADTADTGYVQKRLARKLEDLKTWVDGTVRDANGFIVSFLYGGDGMDAKKLMSVKGLNTPFFTNPMFLARQLNSDARRTNEVGPNEKPRKLRKVEIELLLSYISLNKFESPVIELATQNAKNNLRKIIDSVEIYECKIPDLCVGIRDAYNSSRVQYATMVGLIATSSIGEPTTQMVLNMFHFTGFKGADRSLGVPRFKEIINTTKSADQKHPGCTIYFNYPLIKQNAESVIELERKNRTVKNKEEQEMNNVLIKRAKEDSLTLVQSFRKDFEETYVGEFLVDYELKYLPDIDPKISASPTGLLTYEEYSEEWWVTLAKGVEVHPREYEPKSWVILLKFDVEKLYRRRIELEDIAYALEDKSNGNMICVASPNIIGRIEVYVAFDELRSHARNKLSRQTKLPDDSATEREPFLNDDNMDYFICREVAVEFIRETQVTGIRGISKIHPREDVDTHEWVMDTDGANFLGVLGMPGVDTTRTQVDDMHAIASVLGIEAARRFLFLELTRVISFGGTYINPRHLSVLADAMTSQGNLTAASRDGISRDVGPNAKIMFEKSVDNAILASAFGEVDDMVSLASSVMYGKIALAGPGMVTVRNKERVPVRPPLLKKKRTKTSVVNENE